MKCQHESAVMREHHFGKSFILGGVLVICVFFAASLAILLFPGKHYRVSRFLGICTEAFKRVTNTIPGTIRHI